MFELLPPVKVTNRYGNSIIMVDDYFESCQIYMGEGVEPVDFIKLWGWETNAICRGKRQRGILPTQIERNNVGRWGCTAGWLLFRIGDEIMIWDTATIGFKECGRTFDLSPMNWWKCVPVGQQRLKSVWRKTTVASLMAWYDRVLTLQLATFSTHELAYEESKTRMRNKQIVTRALHRFQGGRDLCSIFPVNYIGRMNLIGKSSGMSRYEIGGLAGVHEFDKDLYPSRTNQMIEWWMKDVAIRLGCDAVLFLRQGKCKDDWLSVVSVNPLLANFSQFVDVLNQSKTTLRGIDCIAVAIKQGHAMLSEDWTTRIMSRSEFRELIKAPIEILFGICNGTALAVLSGSRLVAHDKFSRQLKHNINDFR